jgi:hypothetical protein
VDFGVVVEGLVGRHPLGLRGIAAYMLLGRGRTEDTAGVFFQL